MRDVVERATIVLLIVVVTLPMPLSPATITVDGGCSLADAISSANSDTAVGGCAAGSGADIVRLTSNLLLTSGLPGVTTEISVEGGGFTVARDPGAAEFRFFSVTSSGNLTVQDVTLTGGDAGGAGGAIFNSGVLTLVSSTISGNSAGDAGGGIYADFGAVTNVIDSHLLDNYAFWGGGGLFSYEGGVTISGSTFSGNYGVQGGGVGSYYPYNGIVIQNSTISGNSSGVTGGGLYVLGGGDIVIDNSTLVGNTNSNLSVNAYFGEVMTNSVVAYPASGSNCAGGLADGGGNFDSDGSCAGASAISGLDPLLADNGGPTPTHALLAGSSAIDAGPCGFAVDQRGFGRDADCDSGAFEFEGAPAIASRAGQIDAQRARCRNLTAGGSVDILGATRWNCRDAGLAIDSGHRVQQSVRGKPTGPAFTGTVEGISSGRVTCQNFLTGQTVQFLLGAATGFNCRDQGLLFSGDNTIGWTVTGVAD